jgi:predicted ATPase
MPLVRITARINIMLKRVKIQGYKSLVDVEVELQPLTVLFGPNAAGKSNFLDALQLISRLATSKKLSDAFEPPYRGTVLESFTFGPQGIEGLLKQEKVSFSLEVDIEFSKKTLETAKQYFHNIKNTVVGDVDLANVQFVRFFIEIETNPKSGIIQTSQQTIKVFDSTKTEIGRIPESKIRSGLRSTFLRYYDDIHRYSTPPAYFIALFEELTNWRFFYLEPRERMRQPAPVREARHIGAMGEDIAPPF